MPRMHFGEFQWRINIVKDLGHKSQGKESLVVAESNPSYPFV